MADIPATGHSYDNGKCTVCGAIASDFKAVIIEGANGSWQRGTKDGLSFTSNAAFAHFLKVQVDGKDLDVSNYTVKEGSTIVTLKAEYLETLSVGKHTLAIVSETGTATTEFTVKAAAVTDDTQSPQTGDDSNIALWIAVLLAAVMYAPQEACGVVFDVKAIVPCRGFWALAFAFCPLPEAGAGVSVRSPVQAALPALFWRVSAFP